MSNGDDTAEYCCAAGICCGGDDDEKQRLALTKIITDHTSAHPKLEDVVAYLVDHWDLYPKSWDVATALDHVARIARTFPYV
jgi:hypothetical protein